MILRIGAFTYTLDGRATHEHYQACIKLAGLEAERREIERAIITESLNGNTKELRRLREKARRIVARVNRQKLAATPRAGQLRCK